MTAQQPEAHIKEPYTLAEIKAKIASNDYIDADEVKCYTADQMRTNVARGFHALNPANRLRPIHAHDAADMRASLVAASAAAPTTQAASTLDTARRLFDAGWKACAKFCDRDDVMYDGIVGSMGCPEFETAFDAVWAAQQDKL